MNRKDLDALNELYLSVYDGEQLNEIGVNFGGQKAVDKVKSDMAAERQSNSRLDAMRAQRFGGVSPIVKDAKGGVQGTLDKTSGKWTATKPAPAPAATTPARTPAAPTPASTPTAARPTGSGSTPPSRPAASSTVLAKQKGVEGKLDKATGKFTTGAFSAAEKSRYSSVAAQNAAKSSASTGTPKPSSPTPAASAPKPAIGVLGKTSFERRTPTSAELRAAQTARAGGASPEKALQAAQKTNLPTTGPTPAIPDLKSVSADLARANTPANLNRAPAGSAAAKALAVKPATSTPTPSQIAGASQGIKPATPGQNSINNTNSQKKEMVKSSYEWPSAKTIRDIAGAYASIYEAKKKDQDQDGDNDFADVRIARMIASGVPKEVAIAAVKNKSYNEEVELWVNDLISEGYDLSEYTWEDMFEIYEASVSWNTGKTKSGLSPEEKTRLKFVQYGFSNKPQDQKRAAQLALVHQNMTDAIKKTGKRKVDKVGPIASKRFKNAAIRKRGGKQPSVPIKTVSGLKDANKEAQSKRKVEESFELWVNDLISEGYDLSDYTWDEMYEIYIDEATAMAKRGHDETPIRRKIAKSTGGGKFADKATALENRPTYGDSAKQKARQNLARAQRGDFRKTTSSSPGLHGYAHKSDDPAVKAKQAARGAQRGALTPREKKQLNREAYEAYEFVASYLLENNFASTVEDADVIINNMSEGWFNQIIEG